MKEGPEIYTKAINKKKIGLIFNEGHGGDGAQSEQMFCSVIRLMKTLFHLKVNYYMYTCVCVCVDNRADVNV